MCFFSTNDMVTNLYLRLFGWLLIPGLFILTMKQEKQKKDSYYHLLTRNMLLTVILVSVLPMILVSGIILYQFEISYQEKVHAHLKELVLKHKQNIDTFLREKLDNIRFLGISFSLEELKDETFLRDRLEALQQVYGRVFVDLGVVNSDGIQVAYAGPFKLGKAVYSDANWFLKAMQSDYFKSDVFLGLRGLPHFIIAVRENWKGEKWILRATIDFVAFNNLVENIRIGQTGFAFILNRKAEFQTKPLLELVPDREPYIGFLRDSRKFKDGVQIFGAEGLLWKKDHLRGRRLEARRLAPRLSAEGIGCLFGSWFHHQDNPRSHPYWGRSAL